MVSHIVAHGAIGEAMLPLPTFDLATLPIDTTVRILGADPIASQRLYVTLLQAWAPKLQSVLGFVAHDASHMAALTPLVPVTMYVDFNPDVLTHMLERHCAARSAAHHTQVSALALYGAVVLDVDDSPSAHMSNPLTHAAVTRAFTLGRHFHVACITVSNGAALDVPLGERIYNNTDFVLVSGGLSRDIYRRVWRQHFGFFPTLDAFLAVAAPQLQTPTDWLVLDYRAARGAGAASGEQAPHDFLSTLSA